MNIEFIKSLVDEYKKDPNCWPELWIRHEPLTSEEKATFIGLSRIN